jgi:hypothetical protein
MHNRDHREMVFCYNGTIVNNKALLSIFIILALLISIGYVVYQDGPVVLDSEQSKTLTDEEKVSILKSLGKNESASSSSPAVLSDREKRAVLETLANPIASSSVPSTTSQSSGSQYLTDEEKQATLESLERR